MLSSTSRASGDRAIFFAFLSLLIWLPLPLGSNRAWAWSVMEVWVLLLSLAWLVQYLRGRVVTSQAFVQAWPVTLGLAVVCAWVALQAVPLQAGLLQLLSPGAYEIHAATNSDLTITLNAYGTRVSVLQSVSYLLIFCLVLLLLNDKRRVRLLAQVLVISGVLQAAYGSLMTLSGVEYGFFFEKEAYRGVATGTFVNRNHLAGYLELCLALGIGLMVAQLSATVAATWRDRARRFLETMLSSKALIRLGLVIMVIGLVLTQSRMGNIAFFSSMLITGVCYVLVVRRLTRGIVFFFISLLVIDLFVVGNYFGIEEVANRIQRAAVEGDMRTDLVRDTLFIVKDFPLTGTGAGSFFSVFPMYNTGALEFGFFKHAHNDYLEFATDLGLVALALLAFCVLLSLWQGFRAQFERRDRLLQGMGFASIMAIVALLMHSFTDFNLHIPANAATFMVVMALAWVSRFGSRGSGA